MEKEEGTGLRTSSDVSEQLRDIRVRLKEKVLNELKLTECIDDSVVEDVIDRMILEESRKSYIPLSEKLKMRRNIYYSIRGLDVL